MIPTSARRALDATRGKAAAASDRTRYRGRAALVAVAVLANLIAQQPSSAQEKPIEIGVLALGPRIVPAWRCGPGDRDPAPVAARHETMPIYMIGLRDELERLKYVEDRPENAGKPGRRFRFDLRMGTLPALREAARELARKPVDFMVTVATAATQIAQEEARRVPILFTGISDPIGDGFVQSLARPGGMITGVSHQQVQGSGKRLEMFKEMLPSLRRLITLRRPGYAPSEKSMVEIRAAAEELRVEVLDWLVNSRQELQATLAKAQWEAGDGMMILPDSLIISNVDLILETSLTVGVPVVGLQDFMADWGAVGVYGPSTHQAGGFVARYVDKIVNGAKPGDLPVMPVDPSYVINLKAAACLGVSVPLEVLHQADRIIR